ncbi:hypothetical protein BH10BAC3_BH10BAC3_31120 [soil metagenome]
MGQVTSNKIQGKWQIDSIVIYQQFNGNISNVSKSGTAADYVEFRADGRMLTAFDGNTDNSSYIVQNDSVIVISGDSQYIKALTDNKLVIYNKAKAGVIGFIATTNYLKR